MSLSQEAAASTTKAQEASRDLFFGDVCGPEYFDGNENCASVIGNCKMRSTLTSNQQRQFLQQQHFQFGNNIDPHQQQLQSDVSLNDVIEVIRHSDPATFQEFQNQLSAMSGGGGGGQTAKAALAAELTRQKKLSYVKITEQPASKGLRFRYECEGRSAGSIPGANSSNEHKTYPAIQIVGYRGRAVVVVSCVTAEPPYRPHPHNLVGKEGCKKGVCTLEIPTDTMAISFQSLGIQCVKKKEIEEALTLRQQIRVDPFQTGFSHRENTQSLDLNSVRLCFQVFLEGSEPGAFTFALKPVVSDPIFDKKAKNDLTICRLTECSASVAGGKEMLLFCDKVIKDDIQVRFVEERAGKVVWEGFGDFQPSDVHKQYGIAFRTPRYKDIEIDSPVQVQVHLRRPSDGAVSESRPFEFLPLDAGRSFWTAKRLKTNYSIFNSILSADQTLMRSSDLSSPSAEEDHHQQQLKRKSPRSGGLLLCPVPMPAAIAQPPPMPPTRNFLAATVTSKDMHLRPLSQCSDVSTDTVLTKQSVNDILSQAADVEDMSVYSMDMNDVLDGDLSFQNLMKLDKDLKPVVKSELDLSMGPRSAATHGSMTSVTTVRENKKATAELTEASVAQHNNNNNNGIMDVDVAALYDDVMQCVYDDVDTKYDPVQFGQEDEEAAPAPPVRKPDMSIVEQPSSAIVIEATVDRPLPGTPSKLPTIIATMIGKKPAVDAKKKEAEELKRKEKEAEKEREKQKRKKTKGTEGGKGSLFQRVFSRSKSQSELCGAMEDSNANDVIALSPDGEDDDAPAVPAHLSQSPATPEVTSPPATLNETSLDSLNGNDGDPTEADLSELQRFLDSGNLDHLDNMVTEFAKQYMPAASGTPVSTTGVAAAKNNNAKEAGEKTS